MTQKERIYQILCKHVGKPCPKNIDLGAMLGLGDVQGSGRLLRDIAAAGLIKVERKGELRRVQIVATCQWTDWSVPRVIVKQRQPVKPTRVSSVVKFATKPPRSFIAPSTSCARCGVNTRYGCAHVQSVAA